VWVHTSAQRIILDLLCGIGTDFTWYHTDFTRIDFTLYHRLYNKCWLHTALCGICTDFTLYRWLHSVHWLYSVPQTLQWVMTLHYGMRNIHWLYSVPLTVQCAQTLLCTTDFACNNFALYYWLYNECYCLMLNVHWLYSIPLTLHALTLPCTTDFTICTDFTLYYVERKRTLHSNLKRFTQIELLAKLLHYFNWVIKENFKLYYWLLYTKLCKMWTDFTLTLKFATVQIFFVLWLFMLCLLVETQIEHSTI